MFQMGGSTTNQLCIIYCFASLRISVYFSIQYLYGSCLSNMVTGQEGPQLGTGRGCRKRGSVCEKLQKVVFWFVKIQYMPDCAYFVCIYLYIYNYIKYNYYIHLIIFTYIYMVVNPGEVTSKPKFYILVVMFLMFSEIFRLMNFRSSVG